MVIYDKNQFTFNLVFLLVLIALIMLNVITFQNYNKLNKNYENLSRTLAIVEDNHDFNFIQASHNDMTYSLTTERFIVEEVDNYGLFSGPSMQPVIYDGHTVLEKNYDGSQLKDGQIVRYIRGDGAAVIHRVRADYGSTVYVQGDSEKQGEIINKDQITHVVLGVLFT